MYAARYYKMFIRLDGLMTDNKASAKLFDTVEIAEDYIKDWKITSEVQQTGEPIEIVEVITKSVIQKVGAVVRVL